MSSLARLAGSLAALGLAACSGSEFASGTGGRLSDGGPANGGQTSSEAGGANGKGGTANGGGTAGAGSGGRGGTANGGNGAAGGTRSTGGAAGNGGAGSGGRSGAGGVGAGGVSTAGGNTGAGGTAGAPNSGDCSLAQDTCGTNSRCVEVTPGGYRVCTTPYSAPMTCAGMGQCCKSGDCQSGAKCYEAPLAPQCGGIIGIGSNVCSSDICTSDAACGAAEICVPAGTLDRKVRMCVPAGCRHDTDCRAQPGGICAPVSGGCCSGAVGLYCVYPGGCRTNKECASGNCQIDAKSSAQCSADPAICPL